MKKLFSLLVIAFVFAGVQEVNAKTGSAELPEKVEIILDFTMSWPFNESVCSVENQAKRGEVFMGEPYSHTEFYTQTDYSFFIRGNIEPYEYVRGKYFKPGSKNARITLPAIPCMRLKSVTMEVRNGAQYSKGFKIIRKDYSDLAACQNMASAGNPAVVEFPTAMGADTEAGRQYYMSFTSSNIQVTAIKLVYVKE